MDTKVICKELTEAAYESGKGFIKNITSAIPPSRKLLTNGVHLKQP